MKKTNNLSDKSQKYQNPNQILSAIFNEKNPLVVFDLDSTLFDVSPRLEKVLLDISEISKFKNQFPESVPYFKNIKTLRNDWGFIKVLKRAGVDHEHFELFDAVRTEWIRLFFSNEYIHFDIPYEGATEFVNKIAHKNIKIVYLTGRDVHRMEKGTKEVLLKYEFPLDGLNQELHLKPFKEMDDALFKRDWLKKELDKNYSKIFLFENEPVNINLVKKELPTIETIFFESTHSGQETPPEDIQTIIHYILD